MAESRRYFLLSLAMAVAFASAAGTAKIEAEEVFEAKLEAEDLFEAKIKAEDLFEVKIKAEDLFEAKIKAEDLFEAKIEAEDLFKAKIGAEDLFEDKIEAEELFEGDIRLTPEQRAMLEERKAIPDLAYRWPEAEDGFPRVLYRFQDDMVNRPAIMDAINHWEEETCIRFELTSAEETRPHLQFLKSNGCWSFIGMLQQPGQKIAIGDGCDNRGLIAHEIGHAIGFYHEQSRSDRDEHVNIHMENVIPHLQKNFDKYVDDNFSVPYDLSSDMHYTSNSFTIEGKLTISTKDPLAQELIGQRFGLSHYDKLLANRMYSCIPKWLVTCGLESDPCQNDGYLRSDCICACRSGTSGNFCEIVTQDYHDSMISSCSQNVTSEGNVTSPNYPNNYPPGTKCVKWIQAPKCHFVNITFSSFEMYGQSSQCDGHNCCFFDFLEIRTDDLYNGDVYCGTDITPGTSFTSKGHQLVLFFRGGDWSLFRLVSNSGFCP
ncbi:protein SpAN-like [Palaemon carinicauda]|uniref:protein SpAN-like n=1 Tax=Palaemon carinicauda TaxID=392227 RepID=UPI0035B59C77